MKWLISFAVAVACTVAGSWSARAQEPLRVVTTLSTFADIVKTIGGDHIKVTSIAPPRFNPHFIEPRPSDVLNTKKADLFVHAGLDLEAWRDPLLDAAGNPLLRIGGPRQLDMSRGIALLEVPHQAVSRAEGDIHLFGNPHYWLDPENAKAMAKTVATKLGEMDPERLSLYEENLAKFARRLDEKIPQWQAAIKPFAGAELIGYHNEWPYLMRFLGLKMDKFLEPKPGIPPTPKQTEFIERYMQENHVKAIVQASYFPTKTAQTLGQRTGAKLVILCQGVGELPQASDYIGMIDYDIQQLANALR